MTILIATMRIWSIRFLLLATLAVAANAFELCNDAYPTMESMSFAVSASKEGTRRRKITDITHELRADLPSFDNDWPLTEAVRLVKGMRRDGYFCNLSDLKFFAHSGTHVDAPGHFVNELYEAGYDVNSLDLNVLVGPVLIVDVSKETTNITEQVLQKLNLPRGVERVLFKTANTNKRLMYKPEFESSFIGFTKDGAEWLVANTDIKLVGIDYLSVAIFADQAGPHNAFLRNKLVLVEGLNLDEVGVGLSVLYCLPLRVINAEGCPARCILVD